MKKWFEQNERRCLNNTSSEPDTVPQIQLGHYSDNQIHQISKRIEAMGLPEFTLPNGYNFHPEFLMPSRLIYSVASYIDKLKRVKSYSDWRVLCAL